MAASMCLTVCVCLLLLPGVKAVCIPAIADIVCVIDSSASIGVDNYQSQMQFVADLASQFPIGPSAVQFGAVVFSDYPNKLFDLKDLQDSASIAQALKTAPYMKGLTFIDRALNLVVDTQMFSVPAGERIQAPNIMLLMTDGVSNNNTATLEAAQRLKAQGVQIIAIGIGLSSDAELQAIAGGPQNVFRSPSFVDLKTIELQVEQRLCQALGNCEESNYGCCYDGKSFALGPNKAGCGKSEIQIIWC
ncbi:cartilage matrix protein-like [Physella acuta]|uniref:cartilage matrix protein-like n=1 Tax=Physella acuta TaxID=109671 RepID=UPI0027DE548D|nr:cartilage matrix protein-like [Physella acuta]